MMIIGHISDGFGREQLSVQLMPVRYLCGHKHVIVSIRLLVIAARKVMCRQTTFRFSRMKENRLTPKSSLLSTSTCHPAAVLI